MVFLKAYLFIRYTLEFNNEADEVIDNLSSSSGDSWKEKSPKAEKVSHVNKYVNY